jgi:hypothetical protein
MGKEDGNDVSVIIATLSRPTLGRVLKAIRNDLPKAQIIAITHGAASQEVMSLFLEYGIQHAANEKNSIGHSWNLGLGLVDRKYFTFFSDDDFWIANSLSKHKHKLEESDFDFVLGAVELRNKDKIKKIKPTSVIKETFLELLQTSIFLPGTKYVSLTSFLGKSILATEYFVEDVPFWEDILWLLNLEKSGYRYCQDKTIRSSIEINYSRGSNRETIDSYFVISQYLNRIKPNTGKLFMMNIAVRNSLVAGESKKINELITALKLKSNIVELNKWDFFQLFLTSQMARMIGKVKQ